MTDFKYHRRAQECIAQSYLTNSKRPESLVKGIYPTHVMRGQGCFLWDHTGKKYIDFICGLGTNLLGYANPRVNSAIIDQLPNGACHSLATHLELEVAEKIKELFPFVDAVKLLKTGSEACSAAIRIARAKTGRQKILSEAYHGWHDSFVSLTPPAVGVPPHPMMERLSECDFGDVAGIIIEPIVTDYSPSRVAELQALREKCTKSGTLLIFDEVITGFRFPKYSVSGFFGITPDIIVLGKAIANGMPLSAVGGKYDVMNSSEYFVSSSYAGETLSLVAAKTTMTLLQTVHDLTWLWQQGQRFLKEFNSYWPERLRIEGYPTRGVLTGDPLVKALFMQEACLSGMLFGPSWFLNFPHCEEIANLMPVIKAIFERIKRGEVHLRGEMPQSPFSQRIRETP